VDLRDPQIQKTQGSYLPSWLQERSTIRSYDYPEFDVPEAAHRGNGMYMFFFGAAIDSVSVLIAVRACRA